MFYGGMSNVPGAPGNLVAGSPGYFMPEAEIQRRFQERYKGTPEGQKLQENIMRVREQLRTGSFPFQQAQGNTNMTPLGNTGALLANSQFYGGPQMGQLPANFDAKYVS